MRASKQRLTRHHRRKYPRMQETFDALRAMRNAKLDTTTICEICGDELDETEKCYTCSGGHND